MTDPRTGCPERQLEPPESPIVDRCFICGEDIRAGWIYYDFGGDTVHEDCADDYIRRYRKNG